MRKARASGSVAGKIVALIVVVAIVGVGIYGVSVAIKSYEKKSEGYVDKASEAAYERAQGLTGVMAPPQQGAQPNLRPAVGVASNVAALAKPCDVIIQKVGPRKAEVVKALVSLTTLGEKEAEDLLESAPRTVMSGVSRQDADNARTQLESAGATVEVK